MTTPHSSMQPSLSLRGGCIAGSGKDNERRQTIGGDIKGRQRKQAAPKEGIWPARQGDIAA